MKRRPGTRSTEQRTLPMEESCGGSHGNSNPQTASSNVSVDIGLAEIGTSLVLGGVQTTAQATDAGQRQNPASRDGSPGPGLVRDASGSLYYDISFFLPTRPRGASAEQTVESREPERTRYSVEQATPGRIQRRGSLPILPQRAPFSPTPVLSSLSGQDPPARRSLPSTERPNIELVNTEMDRPLNTPVVGPSAVPLLLPSTRGRSTAVTGATRRNRSLDYSLLQHLPNRTRTWPYLTFLPSAARVKAELTRTGSATDDGLVSNHTIAGSPGSSSAASGGTPATSPAVAAGTLFVGQPNFGETAARGMLPLIRPRSLDMSLISSVGRPPSPIMPAMVRPFTPPTPTGAPTIICPLCSFTVAASQYAMHFSSHLDLRDGGAAGPPN